MDPVCICPTAREGATAPAIITANTVTKIMTSQAQSSTKEKYSSHQMAIKI
jgi:hypothetical protein